VAAAAVLAVDGVLRSARRDAALSALGLTRRQLGQIGALRFSASYATMMSISMVCGVALCVVMTTIGGSVPVPWQGLAFTAGSSARAGISMSGRACPTAVALVCEA
jgi:hypothetical protein